MRTATHLNNAEPVQQIIRNKSSTKDRCIPRAGPLPWPAQSGFNDLFSFGSFGCLQSHTDDNIKVVMFLQHVCDIMPA